MEDRLCVKNIPAVFCCKWRCSSGSASGGSSLLMTAPQRRSLRHLAPPLALPFLLLVQAATVQGTALTQLIARWWTRSLSHLWMDLSPRSGQRQAVRPQARASQPRFIAARRTVIATAVGKALRPPPLPQRIRWRA